VHTARVFFALWPTASVRDALAQQARRHGVAPARAMRPETLHLTLAFVGDVAESRLADLQASVADLSLPACDFQLDRLAYWRHKQLLWAGSRQAVPALSQVARQLAQRLLDAGFPVDQPERTFTPHVTLVRKLAEQPADLNLPPLAWSSREYVLVRSRLASAGADYQPLGRWPLAS
jgi:2'-5' RNA ligase